MEYKEIIEMIANIAVAGGFLFSATVIGLNIRSLRLQKVSLQADLFHKISAEINSIINEQKEVEDKGDKFVENWYERLLDAFEYFAFFANRKLISKDMIEYYKTSVITYCNGAAVYPKLKKMLSKRESNELTELKKYYEKYSGKLLPF